MATKLFRVLTYGQAKSIMKLHESDHVIKRDKSSSTRPIPPHLAGCWRMTLWPCSLVSSHEKLKTKIYIHLRKLIDAKKFKIGILEKKFTWKLISFRQSNFFLQSFLIRSLSLTKISKMILTQFYAMLQFYTHSIPSENQWDQGE